MHSSDSTLARLPSVDRVLQLDMVRAQLPAYGRAQLAQGVRLVLAQLRDSLRAPGAGEDHPGEEAIGRAVLDHLAARNRPALRRIVNLTGTVLHTNLGRAPLPDAAVQALLLAAQSPCNLEFNVQDGGRGDRDDLVADLLAELTGAESATVVNNNAAAVFLLLNTLAARREVLVSRGELIEIGGAFRVPDIMARAGARLREVGTTNRTHLRDYAQALGPRTALVMKVHASNFAIEGFTASVPEAALAGLAHEHGLPLAIDLGSGTLVDLSPWGLPREATPREAIAAGADLVTFSGDKLLGGPQAGIIVGRRALIERIKKNPIKRCLRVGKLTLAALEPVLRLYRNPEELARQLPTLRLLTRPAADIAAQVRRVLPAMEQALGPAWAVAPVALMSQIGSGALPVDLLPSAGLALRPAGGRRQAGRQLRQLEVALRGLPEPVLGRIASDTCFLDLRCLEDEAAFLAQLPQLPGLLAVPVPPAAA